MIDGKITRKYKEILSTYIKKGDERSLYKVSELARSCLAQDLGPEILVEMHTSALCELINDKNKEVKSLVINS